MSQRYCKRFSKQIDLVLDNGDYICSDSLPIMSNHDPCAEKCIHSIVMMETGRVGLSQRGMVNELTPQTQIQQLLVQYGRVQDFAPDN